MSSAGMRKMINKIKGMVYQRGSPWRIDSGFGFRGDCVCVNDTSPGALVICGGV